MEELPRPYGTELIAAAKVRGVIGETTQQALQVESVAKQIAAGLTGSQTIRKPGRITLATLQPDDSISIFTDDAGVRDRSTKESRAILQGHNNLRHGMLTGPDGARSMLHTRYLNGFVLNPFLPLALCEEMTEENYVASPAGTPLFTNTLVTLGIVLTKTEELTTRGARVRTATLIMTDGEATDYTYESQRRLSSVVQDMRESGSHIVAGMGLGEPNQFVETFRQMGIDERHIYTAANVSDILRAFEMFGEEIRLLSPGARPPKQA